jgi:hypothetical protein
LVAEEGKVVRHDRMEEKLKKEYIGRLRLILKTELNSKNKMKAV